MLPRRYFAAVSLAENHTAAGHNCRDLWRNLSWFACAPARQCDGSLHKLSLGKFRRFLAGTLWGHTPRALTSLIGTASLCQSEEFRRRHVDFQMLPERIRKRGTLSRRHREVG